MKLRAASYASVLLLGTSSIFLPQTATAEETHQASSYELIEGGTPQHTDPTSYDYVPENKTATRNAYGDQAIGAFTINVAGQTIHVPSGILHHAIDGKGLHVDKETSWYKVPAQVCNYRIDYQNRGEGKIWSTRKGGTVWDCKFGGFSGPTITNFNLHRGVECARLFVNEEFKGEQCHSIN